MLINLSIFINNLPPYLYNFDIIYLILKEQKKLKKKNKINIFILFHF